MLTVAASSPVRWRGRIPRGFPDKFTWKCGEDGGSCLSVKQNALAALEGPNPSASTILYPGSSVVECDSDKVEVGGSSPPLGTILRVLGLSPNWDGTSPARKNNVGSSPTSSTNFLFPVSKLAVCTSPTPRPEVFDSLTGNQFLNHLAGTASLKTDATASLEN